MGYRTLQLLALAWFVVLGTNELQAKKWTTRDGEYSVEADFVDLVDGKVVLRKENGKTVKIPLDLLSSEDQRIANAKKAAKRRSKRRTPPPGSATVTRTGIRLYKSATVLIDLGENGSGSGFCIRSDGLFVTNRHVVEGKPIGAEVTLVLNATETNEKVLTARVVAVSKKYDLALVKASQVSRLPYLKLGKDNNLIETMSVLALGFPFGKMLSVDEEGYPGITISTGKISAIRKKKGIIDSVQVDAKVNPGNSGGPVLDEDGKVIGVISSGIFGSGLAFAVPVSHLAEFLAEPKLILKTPMIHFGQRHKSIVFEIDVLQFPKKKQAWNVEVTLISGQGPPRLFRTQAKGSGFVFAAVPQLPSKDPLKFLLWARQENVRGTSNDKEIRLDNKPILLSLVRRVEFKDGKNVLTTNYGKTYSGQVTGLGTFDRKRGKNFALAKSKRVDIFCEDEKAGFVYYKIVASQGGKVATETMGRFEFAGAPLPASLVNTPQPGEGAVAVRRIIVDAEGNITGIVIGEVDPRSLPKEARPIEVRPKDPVLAAPVDSGKVDLDKGLAAHWKFDEKSEGSFKDSAGKNHGNFFRIKRAEGILGGAMNFNGKGDYLIVDYRSKSSLNFGSNYNYTVAAWIYADSHQKSNAGIVGKVNVSGKVNDFMLKFDNSGKVFIRHGNGWETGVTSKDLSGDWHHLAVTWYGSSGQEGTITSYLDGVQVRQGTMKRPKISSRGFVAIGCERTKNESKVYKGKIDDVRIYNRTLTATEVSHLFGLSGRKAPKVPAPSSVVSGGQTAAEKHPDGAVQFKGHWYKLYSEKTKWESAAEQCKRLSGQLVCIETAAEAQFVAKLAERKRLWLGGFKNARGQWNWVNGKPMTYTNWATGEPSNTGGIENSLQILPEGTWNDERPSSRSPTVGYICEWAN